MSVFDFIIRFKADGLDQMASSVHGKINSSLNRMGAAAAGYVSYEAIKARVNATVKYAASIKDLSEQTGASTTKIQEWEYAANRVGMSIQEIILPFNRLKLAREAAISGKKGNQDAADFAALGISTGQLKSMSPDETFNAVGRALGKVSEGANTARMSVNFFGREGIKFTNALKSGFMDAAGSAKDLGIVIGEDLVNQMDAADKRMAFFRLRMRRLTAGGVGGAMDAWDSSFPTMAGVAGGVNAFLGDAIRPWRWGSMFSDVATGYYGNKSQAEIDRSNMDYQFRSAEMAAKSANNRPTGGGGGGGSINRGSISNPIQSDVLARIGLFRGGGGMSQTALLQAQVNRLDKVVTQLQSLNGNLTTDTE